MNLMLVTVSHFNIKQIIKLLLAIIFYYFLKYLIFPKILTQFKITPGEKKN